MAGWIFPPSMVVLFAPAGIAATRRFDMKLNRHQNGIIPVFFTIVLFLFVAWGAVLAQKYSIIQGKKADILDPSHLLIYSFR